MAYINQYKYYENEGVVPVDQNWGSYQYVSLLDIVNNFLLMYHGDHSLINNEPRYKIIFHAKRAIQELNYDALKEIKSLQLEVSDNLIFILPPDFVSWVRISLYKNGALLPLNENTQLNTAKTYLQDNAGGFIYDSNGNVVNPQFSQLDLDRLDGKLLTPYINPNSPYNGYLGWFIDGEWYFRYEVGGDFGLDASTANVNPTFRIDKKSGVINFDSRMQGEQCVIEYISDGMENGEESQIMVNKLFEAYVYAYIEKEVLDSKLNVQEYVVNRKRKKAKALLNNAKIRLSRMHPGRLLMPMRGQNNWIK